MWAFSRLGSVEAKHTCPMSLYDRSGLWGRSYAPTRRIPSRCTFPADEAFEVASFGKVRRHGVIRRLAQRSLEDDVGAGVLRRAGDDLLEQLRPDSSGAGERHQASAGPQQLERQQVDVLVAARRPLDLAGGGSEARRVQDDGVERPPLVAQLPQLDENISGDEFGSFRIEVVAGQVLRRHLQRPRRAVDREDPARPCAQRRDREAARIAERVQYVLPGKHLAGKSAILPLVEIEPRLVAFDDIDQEGQAVFPNGQPAGRDVSPQPTSLRSESFEMAGVVVGAFEDAAAVAAPLQAVDQSLAEPFGARREELNDTNLGVTVDDHTREQVRLGVDLAIGIDLRCPGQIAPPLDGGLQTPFDQALIDRLLRGGGAPPPGGPPRTGP